MNDPLLETYAQLSASQLINQYVPIARQYGLNKDQTLWLIKRVAEIAVEKLSKQPA